MGFLCYVVLLVSLFSLCSSMLYDLSIFLCVLLQFLWLLCFLCVTRQFPDLLSALLLAEQKVGCSLRWRLHEKLLQHYSCLARLLPGELLYQSFSPRIFIILTTNVSSTWHVTVGHNTAGGTMKTDSYHLSGYCGCRKCCQCRKRQHGHFAHSCATTANRSSVRRWWSGWSKVRSLGSFSLRCSVCSITCLQVSLATSGWSLFDIHHNPELLHCVQGTNSSVSMM